MPPFGMIKPGVQPLAPLLTLGQMLAEEAAGDHVTTVGQGLDRDADEAGDLLGLREIMFGGLGERSAFERDDALIALARAVAARRRLIEGDRQIALAEQREQRRLDRCLGQLVGIEAQIAAHLAALVVDDEQVDDAALGLRLQASAGPRHA